jgi:hypothetical protein
MNTTETSPREIPRTRYRTISELRKVYCGIRYTWRSEMRVREMAVEMTVEMMIGPNSSREKLPRRISMARRPAGEEDLDVVLLEAEPVPQQGAHRGPRLDHGPFPAEGRAGPDGEDRDRAVDDAPRGRKDPPADGQRLDEARGPLQGLLPAEDEIHQRHQHAAGDGHRQPPPEACVQDRIPDVPAGGPPAEHLDPVEHLDEPHRE